MFAELNNNLLAEPLTWQNLLVVINILHMDSVVLIISSELKLIKANN